MKKTQVLMVFVLLLTVNAFVQGQVPMRDFIGLNVHCGAIYQSGEPGIPQLYAPVTSMIRDYHPMDWDLDFTDDPTNFPYDKWNWINWSSLYGTFVTEGYQVNACIQFSSFDDNDWRDPEADAYAYGYAFATAFGPTYGSGVVTSVQIGNEPGHMSDAVYITVFENMAAGVHDADPALKVVTCNAMDTVSSGDYWKAANIFSGVTSLVDAFAIHTYPMVSYWPDYERSYPEDSQMLYLSDVQDLIDWRDTNASGCELWITEFGYDSSSTSWSGNVTRTQQAQWLTRSFLIWSEMDIDRAYLYYYNDNDTPSFHACSGLTVDWAPKPSYYAQAHLQDMLGDYYFNQVIQKNSSLYIYEYVNESDSDDIMWVMWLPTGSDQESLVTLTGLPATAMWAERMPLTSGPAPTVNFEWLASDSIRLTVTESPTYLNLIVGGTPINQTPAVDAGSDDTIATLSTSLDGTVMDDGLPNPPAAVTTLWTKQSGPGTVTFGDDSAVDTTVTFSTDGVYVLRLTADDSALQAYDEVTITVDTTPVNQAPVVDAGTNQTIPGSGTANLDGTVSDDGLPNPPATVTTVWSVTSQPARSTVTFGNVNAIDTTASFSKKGTYVLRLTADDGDLSAYDEVTITVTR